MNPRKMDIPMFKVFMAPDVPDLVSEVLSSGYVGQGPMVDQLEEDLRQFVGKPYIVTVNSGTSALHLALHMIKHDDGRDEVLTTPLTCFTKSAKVTLDDGTKREIGSIVENKEQVFVQSFNHRTLEWESKKVTNWIKLPSQTDWYWISLCDAPLSNAGGGKRRGAWVTGDHKLFTNKGYIRVDQIDNSHVVLTDHVTLNDKQIQVLTGSLLGDACVSLQKSSSCKFQVSHTKNQQEWFQLQIRCLKGLPYRIDERQGNEKTKPFLSCESGGNNLWRKLRKEWYSVRRKKIIPVNLELSPLAFATWYMDDGSLTGNAATFCTECFDLDSFWRLFWKVADFGFRVHAQKHNNRFRLVITNAEDNESATKFFNMVSPYIPPSMRYKLPADSNLPPYDHNLWELGICQPSYEKISIERKNPPKWERPAFSYCLEVEDNHNFLVSDVLVSNCTATNFPILANGLKLKWVDVDPKTFNLDLNDLRRKISPKTRAIMVVHWGGCPVDLDALQEIQAECYTLYGFWPPVIEDCAHAMGAKYKGKHLGNHRNICMFSFQAIKHFTTVDGGMLVLPDDHAYQRAKLLRWFGLDRTRSADFRCEQNIKEWGYKFQMNDMTAAVGIKNLPHLNGIVTKHRENGYFFDRELVGIPGILGVQDNWSIDCESSYWVYTMRVDNRDGFMRKMREKGIAVSRVHDRNDKHECLKEFRSILPNTDIVCDTMCCIPCGWWVGEEEREYILDCIKEGW